MLVVFGFMNPNSLTPSLPLSPTYKWHPHWPTYVHAALLMQTPFIVANCRASDEQVIKLGCRSCIVGYSGYVCTTSCGTMGRWERPVVYSNWECTQLVIDNTELLSSWNKWVCGASCPCICTFAQISLFNLFCHSDWYWTQTMTSRLYDGCSGLSISI